MARPETLEDLEDWRKGPKCIITIDESVEMSADVLSKLSSLMTALPYGPHSLNDRHIVRPNTEAELLEVLERAQSDWDRNKRDYARWKTTGELPLYPGALKAWARREGLKVPE